MQDRKGLDRPDIEKLGHFKIGNLFKNVLNPQIEVISERNKNEQPKYIPYEFQEFE